MIQDFIINLYNQLFYMSVIATIIGCFILLFRKITDKKLEPRCHYIIWAIFIIALVFPITIPSKMSIYNVIDLSGLKKENRHYSNDTLSLAGSVNEIAIYNNMKNEISNNNHGNEHYFSKLMLDIVFSIFVLKFFRPVVAYLVLKNKIRGKAVKEERIDRILQDCKKALKINRNVSIVKQEDIKVPSIIGIFKLKILFTDTTLLLKDNELKSIMMHELSHYKRKDIFVNWLITFLKALYWFNPIISVFLVYMKIDMELATDALAISKMEDIKDTEYCDVIIEVAKLSSVKVDHVLGLVSTKTKLNDRIDAVFKKEEFKKYRVWMFIATFFMMLFMLLILYPTSYDALEIPKLYLQLEDGRKIDISEEEIVQLSSGDSLKVLAEGGDYKKIILYERHNLLNDETDYRLISLGSETYLPEGEYFYRFILDCNNRGSLSYTIKIFVE